MTKNNNFRIEYLFINFHDNDFFMEMCNSAELIIDSFNKELLVPSKHKEIIKQKSEEHKLNFFFYLYTNSIYSPDVIVKDIYCISKSKLLIPLTLKVYLVNNEENELVYIAEFTRELSFSNDLLKKINNSEMKSLNIHCHTLDVYMFVDKKSEWIGPKNLNRNSPSLDINSEIL